MVASIGFLGACADLAILLALVAAVASARISELARALIATSAFGCAWLLTAVFDALGAAGWTTLTGGGVMVVCIVVLTVTVHLWTQGGDGGEPGSGQRGNDGEGGPGRGRPDAPHHGGGGNDPAWWPEFERQLALYVAERERETQPRSACPRRGSGVGS